MPKEKQPMPTFPLVTLRQLLASNKRLIAVCTGLLSIYQIAEALIAVLLGWLAHSLIANDSVWNLLVGIAALGMALATVSLSWQIGFRTLQSASARTAYELREKLVARVVSDSGHGQNKDELPRQELPTVMGEDVVQAVDIIEIVPVGISALLGTIFCTIVLAMIDLPLGAVVLVLSATVLMVLQGMSRVIERRAEQQQGLLARATGCMTDILQGLPVIAGVAGAHPAYNGYTLRSERAHSNARRLAWISGGYEAVAVGSNALLLSAVGLYAGYRAVYGEVTVGELVTVVALSQFIAEPMRQCSRMPRYIGLARASVRRLQRVSPPPELREGYAVPAARGQGEAIRIYGSGDVVFTEGHLTVVQCTARWADEVIDALVSGEPTMKNHQNDTSPASSPMEVFVRGRDVRELSVKSLRARVLAEPRNPVIFGSTVRDVLRAGSAADDAGRVENDARILYVLSELGLDELSQGGDSVLNLELTEGARNLSGGQRQRLGLARALLAEPEVLVMVDPLSSLDSVTAMKVARAVTMIRRHRTTIVLCGGRAFRSVAGKVAHVKP